MGRQTYVTVGRLTLGLVMVAVWHVTAEVAGPGHLPEPLVVLQRVVESAISGTMTSHVLATLRLATLGFAAGCGAGVALPLLLYPLPRLTNALEPYIVASAGIPKYAVVPLLILWLGIDDAPKLWLVGLLVFYPVFIGVLAGSRHVNGRLLHMIRVLGANRVMVLRWVVWPSMLPFFFAALRIAAPRAVSAAVIGEFLVGDQGIGALIEAARQNVNTAGVFAGVAVATSLVMAATAVVRRVERHAVAWRANEHQLPL